MSIFKTWTNIKCPEFKFSKSTIQDSGDLFIVSDQKKFILDEAAKHLTKAQVENLKKQDQVNFWSFASEKNQIHFFQYKKMEDTHVGGFESCDYNSFKKFFGLKLSPGETVFSLNVDPKFNLAENFVSAFAESVCSVSYNFKNKIKPDLKIGLDSKFQKIFKNYFVRSQAINLARFLVDLPPNELNPTTYADFVKELVKGSKHYKFESISKDLEDQGYGLIHAVGMGSKNPPQLVRVTNTNSKVALVGKGITFDTGGLDLKPSKFMRNMKKDMGGSAAVVSVLYYLIQTEQNLKVDFYIALAENSVGGNSFRPGDIHKAGNGLTVEIDNTDAEGRLVLADAFSWLSKQKNTPETVIDVATLTGAIKVGLGSYVGGLFSNDQKLSESLFESSKLTGDFVWPMPMPYWTESEMTKTEVADLVNSSQSGYGGAITAAQFLKFFIPKKSKWAHLDIYSWVDGKKDVLRQPGGSGQGVMLLIDWLEKQ